MDVIQEKTKGCTFCDSANSYFGGKCLDFECLDSKGVSKDRQVSKYAPSRCAYLVSFHIWEIFRNSDY